MKKKKKINWHRGLTNSKNTRPSIFQHNPDSIPEKPNTDFIKNSAETNKSLMCSESQSVNHSVAQGEFLQNVGDWLSDLNHSEI